MNHSRSELKRQYGELFEVVTSILFREDPVGINFGDNTDEYDPEAGTIIPRLKEATSTEDVEAIVFQEFCRWFDGETVGSRERYQSIAAQIWMAWQAHQLRSGE